MSDRLRCRREIDAFLDGLSAATPAGLRGDLGLSRARALFRALGNPQDDAAALHVAGTAGKGSTATFAAAVLAAHGHTVGTHLSPHVHDVLERFQIDGRPIDPGELVRHLPAVGEAVRMVAAGPWGRPTFFEASNALAFRLFAGRPVDYAVVETGIGGALDSTNAISRPDKVAVLTPIARDYTDVLGNSLAEIVRQKVGILPVGGRAVAHRSGHAEVDDIIGVEAARHGCRLEWFDPDSDLDGAEADATGCWRGTLATVGGPLPLAVGVPGRHQLLNAALAVRAVELLARRDGWRLDPDAVRAAVVEVRLPGRFEARRRRGRDLVLDGADNAAKLGALTAAAADRWPGRALVWLVAMAPGKDLVAAIDVLAAHAGAVVTTEFSIGSGDHLPTTSVPAADVAAQARCAGVPFVLAEPDALRALNAACSMGDPDLPVIVAGSFRLVSVVGLHTGPFRELAAVAGRRWGAL